MQRNLNFHCKLRKFVQFKQCYISLNKIFLVSIVCAFSIIAYIRDYLQLGLMGMEFNKLKKNNFPTDRPIPEKQGRARGNKNIFKVGLIHRIDKFFTRSCSWLIKFFTSRCVQHQEKTCFLHTHPEKDPQTDWALKLVSHWDATISRLVRDKGMRYKYHFLQFFTLRSHWTF